MKIYTPFGTNGNATRQDLEDSLDALQKAQDSDVFVGVERDDGSFLQMARLPIEYRGPGWPMPRRGSVPPGVRAMFHEFAEGKGGWDRGVEWVEDPPIRWWQALPWWVVVLPFVALIALFLLVAQCSG